MSARKNWDIAPSGRKKPETTAKAQPSRSLAVRAMSDMRPRAKQVSAPAPVPRSSQASVKNVTISRGTAPRPVLSAPLKKRRKEARQKILIALGVLAVLLVAISFYVLWQPWLRIQDVTVSGPHAEEARQIALQKIAGAHVMILPKSSIFFVPESDIRTAILAGYPDIEAVSLSANGLHTLTVTTLPRAQAFLWCGAAPGLSDGTCYDANAEGLIFDVASPESVSSSLRIYAPLDQSATDSPIRAHVEGASSLPGVLQFVKALEVLGADVSSVALRADEADLFTRSGTRITYVLGHEEQAAGLAASAFPDLHVNDGTLEYVDLRFDGKIYSKKRGE